MTIYYYPDADSWKAELVEIILENPNYRPNDPAIKPLVEKLTDWPIADLELLLDIIKMKGRMMSKEINNLRKRLLEMNEYCTLAEIKDYMSRCSMHGGDEGVVCSAYLAADNQDEWLDRFLGM